MKSFQDGQIVRVMNPDPDHLSLKGQKGMVMRLRRADEGAWVDMESLPADLKRFPAGDRSNHVLLWPDECENADS